MNWIKDKWVKFKKWIIVFFIGGTVLAAGLTALPEQAQIDKDVINLKKIIESDRQPNGKYKRRDKQIINGVEYEVHEYETSKGEIGYTIFITEKENNKIYKKAISTGVEKAYRENNRRLIQDNNIYETTTTATST